MNVKQYLERQPLLFDGAMGTYYASLYPDVQCEQANLTAPERITAIHRAYLEAGARAIKTNTFAANTRMLECDFAHVQKVIEAAWKLACAQAEQYNALVFADIGPIPGLRAQQEYKQIMDVFLSLGAKNFLFETFPDDADIPSLATYAHVCCPDAFVMASFAASPDGFTTQGADVRAILKRMADCPLVDAAGLNCVSGPSHLLRLVTSLQEKPELLSVMPNAGYPTVVRGRTFFEGSPQYFASRMVEIAAAGAHILGGCCGTTPEHIRQTARALREGDRTPAALKLEAAPVRKTAEANRLAEKLAEGKRIIAVELDPPADSNMEKFLHGAQQLCDAGVDAITIADCPIARARADSSMLAAKLHRELGVETIPHMTCRDRNLNATKALLIGLSAEGVHNVLTVTGDPIPSADRSEIKGVFSFHSVMLAQYIRELAEQGITAPFQTFGALNVNAVNFQAELDKARRKEEAGVSGFLTQPIFADRAFENLQIAHEALSGKILGGIMPIVSHRNALFMSNEISGIVVPEEIVERYEGLERDEAEALAVELSVEFARRMEPYTAGWYLVTPFQRVALIARIMEQLLPKETLDEQL